MHQAGIDDMDAGPDEAGFLLQLRPPQAADPAALAHQIDLFTARFLAQHGPEAGRYARLGPLTWALAAPEADCDAVHDAAQALGVTLFGTDDDTVWLIERGPHAQPAGVHDADTGDVWDVDAGPGLETGASLISLDSLVELPARPSGPDIASELTAFRTEMRAIARAIPDAADRERAALGAFREELEQITRAAGDRFETAAGRIETATASLPDAAARVEASAAIMETSVREALEALTRACAAMSASRDGASRTG